jgi:predicted transcriptional regulator
MRRPEIAIYSDIIDAISKHGAKSSTKIQNTANLEYERMKRLMKKMQNFGLLETLMSQTKAKILEKISSLPANLQLIYLKSIFPNNHR